MQKKICFILCLLCVLVRVPVYAENLFVEEASREAVALFARINETPPSNASIKENEAIIRERIACFSKNFSYTKRAKICMEQYQTDVVAAARENIGGRPEVGLFIKNIAYCPIMYNFCVGQVDDTKEPNQCIVFERQCIDYMLDSYWRGIPLYDNMQLRIE